MHHRAILSISAALVLVSLPHASFAQVSPKPRSGVGKKGVSPSAMTRIFDKDVRELLKMAEEEEKAEHQDKARELYQQAHAVGKSAATEAELGLADLRAQQYISAARHLSSCLKNYNLRVLARSEDFILDKLDEAKKHVGTLNVRVNVPKSIVNVDGMNVRDWPFHDQIFVVPGTHNVKAMKLGYFMSQINVDIEAGQTKEVTFALQERERETVINMTKPLDLNVNATAAAGEKEPGWTKPLLITSSVMLAVSIGTLAFGFMNKSTANDEWTSFNEAGRCQDPANAPECDRLKEEAASRRDLWNGVAIAGGIGAGISIAGIVIGLVSRPSTPIQTQVTVQPVMGAGETGATVRGRF